MISLLLALYLGQAKPVKPKPAPRPPVATTQPAPPRGRATTPQQRQTHPAIIRTVQTANHITTLRRQAASGFPK
jgi:hypothetical protein